MDGARVSLVKGTNFIVAQGATKFQPYSGSKILILAAAIKSNRLPR
ncbi:hypothetical protein [uncultured Campylobacter sp.]|nr:hypothetical protein [uncultured Campylobacter sp.]